MNKKIITFITALTVAASSMGSIPAYADNKADSTSVAVSAEVEKQFGEMVALAEKDFEKFELESAGALDDNGYYVYYTELDYDGGETVSMTQKGDGEISIVSEALIKDKDDYQGKMKHVLYLCKAVKPGRVYVEFTKNGGKTSYTDGTCYDIADDLSISYVGADCPFIIPDVVLPCNTEEYEAWQKEHGIISSFGEYVVYCNNVSMYHGGELKTALSGKGQLEEVHSYYFRWDYADPMPVAGMGHCVFVYKAVSAGTAEMNFYDSSPTYGEHHVYSAGILVDTDLKIYVASSGAPVGNDGDPDAPAYPEPGTVCTTIVPGVVLPENTDEYETWVNEHGTVSCFGEYVVFCGNISKYHNGVLNLHQSGEGSLMRYTPTISCGIMLCLCPWQVRCIMFPFTRPYLRAGLIWSFPSIQITTTTISSIPQVFLSAMI